MIDAAATGLRTALLANGTLTALLSTTTAVFRTQAPATAAIPYVVLIHSAGGTQNTSPRDSFDMRWSIKAIADTAAGAAAIAAQIRLALHNQTITLPGTWKAQDCQELAVFEYAENVSGKQIWHTGAVYQLRATT
jgi:uncharacterized protein DUF3168